MDALRNAPNHKTNHDRSQVATNHAGVSKLATDKKGVNFISGDTIMLYTCITLATKQ